MLPPRFLLGCVALTSLVAASIAGCGGGGSGDGATTTTTDTGAGAGAGSTAHGGGGDGGANTGGGGGSAGGGTGGEGAANGGGGAGPDCDADPHPTGSDLPDVVHVVAGVTVSTLAGSSVAGSSNGLGAAAHFDNPVNLVLDNSGHLVIAEYDGGRLRVSTTAGDVTTLTNQSSFARPFGLVVTATGKLLVQTDWNELGQNTGPLGGVIWSVAANGAATALVTQAGRPRGMLALADGRVVLADISRHDLRILDPVQKTMTPLAGLAECPSFADGTGASARFSRPYGMVLTSAGTILVVDQGNHRIREVTLAGEVTTFAGNGVPDMIDGDLAAARFDTPQDLAIDAAGNVYVTDWGNHRIRRIAANGAVETLAGDGTAGFQDGAGAQARFFGQEGIAVKADGTALYVADGSGGEIEPYHRIRRIALP